MQTLTRTQLLALDEQQLLAQCRCEASRGTGPGGQKRNKTSSAIQVTHLQTGLSAYDDQERSQQINKHHALQKLRLAIALNLRESPIPWTAPIPSIKNDAYIQWIAVLLDHLNEHNFSVAETAAALGMSTSKLVKEMSKTTALWQHVNSERTARGFSQLKMP